MGKSAERRHQYDVTYMKMAMCMSELSYARRAKVGCIIVSPDDQVISQGYNGMPTGCDNNCEYELPDGTLKTKEEVLHAETNAISKNAKYRSSTKDATLYVTLSPCMNCAKLIVQAEISRVVYLEDYRDNSGLELLRRCGIKVEKLSGII